MQPYRGKTHTDRRVVDLYTRPEIPKPLTCQPSATNNSPGYPFYGTVTGTKVIFTSKYFTYCGRKVLFAQAFH